MGGQLINCHKSKYDIQSYVNYNQIFFFIKYNYYYLKLLIYIYEFV